MSVVAAEAGIPLAITLYGYDVSRLAQQDFWVQKYPPAFETASCLIGISGHICKRIEALGGDESKIEKWHLGVDLSNFEYRPAIESFDGDNVRCLHVGRLVEKKSPLDLVNAFKHAIDIVGDEIRLSLKMVGDGPLRADTEKAVRDLGLERHVTVLGSVPHHKVSDLLAESNLYTQHCRTASDGDQEGQGVSFVEASASGLPIIATRHNGLPDVIVDGETGYLVEEGDTEAMGKKIAQLAQAPDVWGRLGESGRKHIEENFDLKSQAPKMKDLFYRLVS
jgi:glycosyltransferase involved in cell wall biosynthesis